MEVIFTWHHYFFFLYFWFAANQICSLFHPSYFLSCHSLCFWQRQRAALAELLFSPKGCYTLFAHKPTSKPNWQALLGRITHRDVFKMNVSDVVVWAALPGIVEPEGQGTRVPTIQGSKFAEGAVLDIDWAIVELNASNGKIPKTHWKETETDSHDIGMRLIMYLGCGQSCSTWFSAAFF